MTDWHNQGWLQLRIMVSRTSINLSAYDELSLDGFVRPYVKCGILEGLITMATTPIYSTAGSETEKIDVRLSYGIVRLFSEGLYASPNKAVEELVANSFDAGARRVAILLPADFHDQGATIVVLDDGEGMDASGLKTHWLIGKSLKRALQNRPLGRQQIGKFGIGKLCRLHPDQRRAG